MARHADCTTALFFNTESDMTQRLYGMKVAILVGDYCEQIELTSPRQALEQEGAAAMIVSAQRGRVRGLHHVDQGDEFEVDATFDDVTADDFSGVLLPGGVVNADQLRILPGAQRFIRACADDGKPIAVICHGAWLLVSSGLARGRTLTSWPTLRDDIINAGGSWEDRPVVVDGEWISSRKPDDLPAFNREMIDLFEMHPGRWQHPGTVGADKKPAVPS